MSYNHPFTNSLTSFNYTIIYSLGCTRIIKVWIANSINTKIQDECELFHPFVFKLHTYKIIIFTIVLDDNIK